MVPCTTDENTLQLRDINQHPSPVNNTNSSVGLNKVATSTNTTMHEQNGSPVINNIMNQISRITMLDRSPVTTINMNQVHGKAGEYNSDPQCTLVLSTVDSNNNNNNCNIRNQDQNSAEENIVEKHPSVSINEGHKVSINSNQDTNEALYLGKIKQDQLYPEQENLDSCEETPVQCVYFSEETDSRDLHCISTSDDNKIALKVVREIILQPNHLTKVQLTAIDRDQNVGNKELILTPETYLPDGLRMDNSLVKLQGLTCETYVYNTTDKGIRMLPGEHFCHGIILDYPTMGVTERTFYSISSTEERKLDKEVG